MEPGRKVVQPTSLHTVSGFRTQGPKTGHGSSQLLLRFIWHLIGGRSSAGHVVVEAYLSDHAKWIMIDPQWDAVPVLHGFPLNAVELEEALARKEPKLSLSSLSGTKANRYFHWITPYLYYFNVKLDNRYVEEKSKQRLMLVPLGTGKPRVFQRKYPLENMIYTHSKKAFYPEQIG